MWPTRKAGGGKGKGKGAAVVAGGVAVESVNADAKTFKLANNEKVYKFTDATVNKDMISVGAVLKLTYKDGSFDEVVAVETAPAKAEKVKRVKKAK
ncbi:MAG: hypothetical protein NTV49_09480 [Kiritimatiellaeota bacterium]|nr:hypothetical protein [Kiritimatiellota bacterium]